MVVVRRKHALGDVDHPMRGRPRLGGQRARRWRGGRTPARDRGLLTLGPAPEAPAQRVPELARDRERCGGPGVEGAQGVGIGARLLQHDLETIRNVSVPRLNEDTRLRLMGLPPGGNFRDLPKELTERYLTGERWGSAGVAAS